MFAAPGSRIVATTSGDSYAQLAASPERRTQNEEQKYLPDGLEREKKKIE